MIITAVAFYQLFQSRKAETKAEPDAETGAVSSTVEESAKTDDEALIVVEQKNEKQEPVQDVCYQWKQDHPEPTPLRFESDGMACLASVLQVLYSTPFFLNYLQLPRVREFFAKDEKYSLVANLQKYFDFIKNMKPQDKLPDYTDPYLKQFNNTKNPLVPLFTTILQIQFCLHSYIKEQNASEEEKSFVSRMFETQRTNYCKYSQCEHTREATDSSVITKLGNYFPSLNQGLQLAFDFHENGPGCQHAECRKNGTSEPIINAHVKEPALIYIIAMEKYGNVEFENSTISSISSLSILCQNPEGLTIYEYALYAFIKIEVVDKEFNYITFVKRASGRFEADKSGAESEEAQDDNLDNIFALFYYRTNCVFNPKIKNKHKHGEKVVFEALEKC